MYSRPALQAEPPPSGGMQIQAEHGSLDREDVQEAVDPHFQRLVRCYDSAEPARDFASGQVTLRFVVGLDGRSTLVHVRSSDLGSWEVEGCLAAEASRIRFPRPQGYGVATFEYSLEFHSTGAIPVVDLSPSALAADLPVIGVRLAEDCDGLGTDQLRATLYINRRGKVRSVGFSSMTPLAPDRGACLSRSIRRESLSVQVHGAALGRVAIELRSSNLVSVRPAAPPPPAARAGPSRAAAPAAADRQGTALVDTSKVKGPANVRPGRVFSAAWPSFRVSIGSSFSTMRVRPPARSTRSIS